MKAIVNAALQTLLQDFYNLTGIKTCLFDAEGNELCYYPPMHSRFCALLRRDAAMDQKCRACDREGFAACRAKRAQHYYVCHAGLRECISPIQYEGQIIGFIMLGQIKESAHPSALTAALIERMGAEFAKAYEELPSIANDKRLSAFRILDACAGYEHLKSLSILNVPRIDRALEDLVQTNISGSLSVPFLCAKLHLSHNEIYSICKEYFASTPAEYIKNSRIAHAKRLLEESDLPVCEIAVRCGIPDYNYFSKVFKAAAGMSPTAYRKSFLQKNLDPEESS